MTFSPAAADTILAFLEDTGTKPTDYDAIFTGDLGTVGSELLYQLADISGVDLTPTHRDFGVMMFDIKKQDVHAGGSGCGCSASLLSSYVMQKFSSGEYKNVLYCATGALLSPTSVLQGQTIPSVCHLVQITS